MITDKENIPAENSIAELPTVGIIGMGWVGRAYADDFTSRLLKPVCYSLEEKYLGNKEAIKKCDIVLIAVPTPALQEGADYSILRTVLQLVGNEKIALVKSTILPGTSDQLQKEYPHITIIHSPEFLSVATAARDAANPVRNIFGLPQLNEKYEKATALIQKVLPKAGYTKICTALEAEIIKYSHNIGGYIRIVYHNLLYDVCSQMGGDWATIKEAMAADPDNLTAYLDPVHKNGRGAGGVCFIKDFYAFRKFYNTLSDEAGSIMLESIENKNISLLQQSGKDIHLLDSIYFKDAKQK